MSRKLPHQTPIEGDATLPRFVRVADLVQLLRISRSSWYAWRAAGKVPPGFRVCGVVVYNLDHVLQHLGLEASANV